jgi:hypothetical protein
VQTRASISVGVGGLLMLLGMFGSSPTPALAANGDVVHETRFSNPCPSGSFQVGRIGVGIAFDGEFLWYSCGATGPNPDLYKANALSGNVVASFNVAGGLGALAWDGKRKRLWAGWGGGAGSDGDVRLINPNTGVGTVAFNATEAAFATADTRTLDDGLAYDFQTDSLFVSPDTSLAIYNYSIDGQFLGSFPWTGSGTTPDGHACFNSGVAIGGDLLFQGSDGCNHVWVINRSDRSPAFEFDTGADGVRDEDLECDSVTFSPRTVMWSIEAYEPRRAIAFEIPPGSCATGGGVDSDGDGLLDEWETNGVTIDPDGDGPLPPKFIDLKAMGADPQKPDIFLQIDWMECAQAGGDCVSGDTHGHKLDPAAIKKVVDAFAASPYTSPTGSVGISLHVDQGPSSTLNFASNKPWGQLSQAKALQHVNRLSTTTGCGAQIPCSTSTTCMYDWGPFEAIKNAEFISTGRVPIFHYIISGHDHDNTTSSGISRGIGASDLIVSLGSWPGPGNTGSINEQTGTLMHELGHNLELHHGGGDDVNFKPNYLSIMSYAFQTKGVIKSGDAGTFDYSRTMLADLTENNLDEPSGLGGGAAGYGTRRFCASSGEFTPVADARGPIDWDCDGDTTGTHVSSDINSDGCHNTLTGFNDWANVKLKGGAIGLAGAVANLPMQTEPDLLTVELDRQIVPIGVPPTPTPNVAAPTPMVKIGSGGSGCAITATSSTAAGNAPTVLAVGIVIVGWWRRRLR